MDHPTTSNSHASLHVILGDLPPAISARFDASKAANLTVNHPGLRLNISGTHEQVRQFLLIALANVDALRLDTDERLRRDLGLT